MVALDTLGAGLVVGLIVLAVTLTVIVMNQPAARTVRLARPVPPPPTKAVASPPRAVATTTVIQHVGPVAPGPAGQLAAPPDLPPGQRLTVDAAAALAEQLADSDPARIVEVISYWMHEDSADPGSNRSR